ncbi:DUF7694 domain-containing protein [Bradyrhizobium sp. USDA 4508]
MRLVLPSVLEEGRLRDGPWGSSLRDGPAGAFFVMGPKGAELKIISSGPDREYLWEHVSVSTERRTPNWAEMCFVKDLFWNEDECVVQYHPPRSEYVNHHPYCLHLWRPIGLEFPMPPSILVGPRSGP